MAKKKMKKHVISDDATWFHPESSMFLSSLLKPDWIVLETGCGSSTIWFSSRVKRVISFEHSNKWHTDVKKIIEDKKIKNIDLQLKPSYPEKGIFGFKENEFNFVSIDGRGRVKSIETVLPYLKNGGYLLLDDSERKRYEYAIILLNKWESKIFGDNNWQTTIWKKPEQ